MFLNAEPEPSGVLSASWLRSPETSRGDSDVPNVGSTLHGEGECKPEPSEIALSTAPRPCAWFWKSRGCTNGAKCDYCRLERKRASGDGSRQGHLCPAGALKAGLHSFYMFKPSLWREERKKAKVAAIRSGGSGDKSHIFGFLG